MPVKQEVRPEGDDERVEVADRDEQAVEQPDARAGQRARITAGTTGTSCCSARSTTMPVTVNITVTGVRSMPPPMSTSVAKAAAIPMTATASVMLSRFCR